MNNLVGNIIKITGSKIVVKVSNLNCLKKVSVIDFNLTYVSIGSLLFAFLVDKRKLILYVEEIANQNGDILIFSSIYGIYDESIDKYTFGTNSYPIINEPVYMVNNEILRAVYETKNQDLIGYYAYDSNITISYNPNVLFGKHLGVFGNTGSGKTCTIVSLIQNYLKHNTNKNIKFIIFDVNGEYSSAFSDDAALKVTFDKLKANHNILSLTEYGKLFRASEGIQFPALKKVISVLSKDFTQKFSLNKLKLMLNKWVDDETPCKNNQKDIFQKNSLLNFLRTMIYRIENICEDKKLMSVIDDLDAFDTLVEFSSDSRKILILDLQVSMDTLDIILFILFKSIYYERTKRENSKNHYCLVLEEAHRYINYNLEETKLGNYYIDKLAREGRKFGSGLIFSSQVPSMLSYEIVSQCNSVIMHKVTNKRDLEFLHGVLRLSNDSFYYQMSSLEKQYAIVCGEAFKTDSLVKILNANPIPQSNDPVITSD